MGEPVSQGWSESSAVFVSEEMRIGGYVIGIECQEHDSSQSTRKPHTLPIGISLNLDAALNQPIRRQTGRLQRAHHGTRNHSDAALEGREALE